MDHSSRCRPPGGRNLLRLPGILVFILLLLAGFRDDPPEGEPTLGFIEVTTMTEGNGAFPDSYTILFDGGSSGEVGPNHIFTISYGPRLPRGRHWVELSEVPDHCQAQPEPRPLTGEPNKTLPTTFLLRCRKVEG